MCPPGGTSRDGPRGLHPPRKEAYLDGPARLLLPQTINNIRALDAVVDAVSEIQKRPCSGQHRHIVSNILATIGHPKIWTVMVRLRQTGNALSLEGFDCDTSSFI